MRLPRLIRVGAYRYAVTFKKGMGRLGETDSNKGTITLQPGQGPDYLADTLLHEVLHACWWRTFAATGLEFVSQPQEESIIAALTPTLLEVLRDNPVLVKFLTGR